MKAKTTTSEKTSREFTAAEIEILITDLFNFLNEKPDNIFVNDFLILEKKLRHSDIKILKTKFQNFETAFKDAMSIEETKLKKFAAADRLNASFVKEILTRDHNTY